MTDLEKIIGPALADLNPDEIYVAGLKEGARRERRALRRFMRKEFIGYVWPNASLLVWLKARPKKGKKP